MLLTSVGPYQQASPASLLFGANFNLNMWWASFVLLVRDTADGCSSKARTILLRVVASLGSHIPEAGATSKLFDMLSDGIPANDIQCKAKDK